ncbi:MAG: hypothetical protein RIE06_22880 [Roseibium album]|uniref:hypothetical protein n=1 Tax=Roseibium album TaxID=311410 RepID=UPI0032EDF324
MQQEILNVVRQSIVDDPGFYVAKANMRAAFPDAVMIEIVDDVLTVVDQNCETQRAYL